MRVLLVTSGDERCGIAAYGENLFYSLYERNCISPDLTCMRKFFHTEGWEALCAVAQNFDIVHINYEPGLFQWLNVGQILHLRNIGKKTLLTLHTSHSGNNRTEFTNAFDRVVVHEKTEDGFMHIPMGIVKPEPEKHPRRFLLDYINSVGFPFPWKGFPEVAEAAELLGTKAIMFIPGSHHGDPTPIVEECKRRNPSALIHTDWVSDQVIINTIRQCKASVFAYHGGNLGISGAVRLGLAAERPIVLTRCRQFRDLFDYEDEIEFVDAPVPQLIADGVRRVLENGKVPKRVLEDMSWEKSAAKYYEVYQEMMR